MGKRVDGTMAFASDVGSFWVQPDLGNGLPFAGIACPPFGVGRTGSFIDAVALGEQRPVLAMVALIGRDEAKRAVEVLEVIPAHETLNPSPRLVDGREAAVGQLGKYLQVRNRASEKGLSLLTRGRLKDSVTPSRSILTLMVAPFMGLPLSAWSASGLVRHLAFSVTAKLPRAHVARWMLLVCSTPLMSDLFDAPSRRRLMVVSLLPKAKRKA